MRTPRFNNTCCVGDYGCPDCRNKEREMQNETYEAPDSYAITNAQRRERNATAELRAEADYRSTRTRDFESEYAEADAFYAARPAPRVLSAAELEPYAAPNSYPSLKETR